MKVIELQLHFDCNSITNYFSIIPLKLANDLEFFAINFNILYFKTKQHWPVNCNLYIQLYFKFVKYPKYDLQL